MRKWQPFYSDTRLDNDRSYFLFFLPSYFEFTSRRYASSQRTLFSNLKLIIYSLPSDALYAYFLYSNTIILLNFYNILLNFSWTNEEELTEILKYKQNGKKQSAIY